ncbi:DUF3795 domain-containing protein [Methanocella sp. MCL-LM]|uniref:DUF3795 domain-containing protein n=1 Tax=Methanocella sp. MCL-LM TaxID=3412035 RepID=UPI003C71CD22
MSKQSTVCGAFCSDCNFYGKECKGCAEGNGEPFWAAHNGFKACPIHDCCTGKEHLAHCGQCRQLPCQLFRDIRDPSMSDEQFEAGLKAREAELRHRQGV